MGLDGPAFFCSKNVGKITESHTSPKRTTAIPPLRHAQVVGDLSFLHDINGLSLMRAGEARPPLTVVSGALLL